MLQFLVRAAQLQEGCWPDSHRLCTTEKHELLRFSLHLVLSSVSCFFCCQIAYLLLHVWLRARLHAKRAVQLCGTLVHRSLWQRAWND